MNPAAWWKAASPAERGLMAAGVPLVAAAALWRGRRTAPDSAGGVTQPTSSAVSGTDDDTEPVIVDPWPGYLSGLEESLASALTTTGRRITATEAAAAAASARASASAGSIATDQAAGAAIDRRQTARLDTLTGRLAGHAKRLAGHTQRLGVLARRVTRLEGGSTAPRSGPPPDKK